MSRKVRQWAGLIAAVCTALMGNTHMLPEPYDHIVAVIGTIASVLAAYRIEPKRRLSARTRKEDHNEMV